MNNEYENNYEETDIMNYEETYGYESDSLDVGEVEVLDKKTLKLIEEVTDGIEVPTDEEAKAAVSMQHGDSEWGKLASESARMDIIRTPLG